MNDEKLRLFVAFEGGGAKGIVHVGALRAIEENSRLQISGVAGTSAGAIVAALVAAGFSSEEMVASTDGTSKLLESVGAKHVGALFGWDWFKLRALALLFRRPAVLLLVLLVLITLLAVGAWFIVGGVYSASYSGLAGLAIIAGPIYLLVRAVLGVASLNIFVEKFDQALSVKLGRPGRSVRFSHLPIPLRIVATDIGRRQLKLYSEKTTPDEKVARAVAASAALPVAFRARVQGKDGDKTTYVDGGFVSNIPAWTFDEERALDPDSVTFAIEIDDQPITKIERRLTKTWDWVIRQCGLKRSDNPNAEISRKPLNFLRSVVRAAIFGAGVLEKRGSGRLIIFRMATDVGVLDFDMTKQRAMTEVESARKAAKIIINHEIFASDRLWREACRFVHDRLMAQIADTSERRGGGQSKGIIRVNLAFPEPGANKSLRIRYGFNMEGFADNDMLLPISGSITGRAFQSRLPQLYRRPFPAGVSFPGSANRHRRALSWQEMKWCLSLPIFGKDGVAPIGALNVDSNVPIEDIGLDQLDNAGLEALFDALTTPIKRAFEEAFSK